jgi:hypothetical protein
VQQPGCWQPHLLGVLLVLLLRLLLLLLGAYDQVVLQRQYQRLTILARA